MSLLPAKLFDSSFVGLSLTQSAIRLVTVDAQENITSNSEIQLPANTFEGGVIQVEPMAATLKQLISQSNLKSKYVSVSLPEYYSYTRSHTLPSMPYNDVSEALEWQIEKILPLPKESVYFDWKLISEENDQLQILVIAMPKQTLDALIQVFESVNLKPISFEPSASSLTRVLKLPKEQPAILVEINPSGSSATLIENNISYLTITNQFTSTNSQQIQSALQKTGNSIQQLIQHCSAKDPNQLANLKVLLTGEGASNEVAQWLQSLLQRPIELLQIPGVSPHFHQAYSAASVTMVPVDRSIGVNLLPDKLRDYYDTTRRNQKTANFLKFGLIASFISLAITGVGLGLAIGQATRSNTELIAVEQSNSGYNYNSQDIVSINQSSQAIVQYFPLKSTPVEKYEALFLLPNEGIRLTTISYNQGNESFSVSGVADTRANLLDFVDAIKSSPDFAKADLPVSALEKPNNIDFSIVIVFETQG